MEEFVVIVQRPSTLLSVRVICYRCKHAINQKSGMLALQSLGLG
jgi:hypothetical protein